MSKGVGSFLLFLPFSLLCLSTFLIVLAPYFPVDFWPWVQLMVNGAPLLLVACLILFLWTWHKKRWWLMAGTLVFFGLNGWIVGKDVHWERASDTPREETGLKILSYNLGAFDIRSNKVNEAVALFRDLQPDIMSFQEFRNHKNKQGQNALQYISEALEMPFFVFVHLPVHVHGAAIFSRYPIEKLDTLYLPREEINSGILATIKSPDGRLGVASIHNSSFRLAQTLQENPRWRDRKRILWGQYVEVLHLQQEKVDQVLRKLDSYPDPIVLCGDFNAPPHSRIMASFGEGLSDSFAEKGSGAGWTYPILGGFGLRIDYQFFSEELAVQSHQVIPSGVSDHYPILARYTFLP